MKIRKGCYWESCKCLDGQILLRRTNSLFKNYFGVCTSYESLKNVTEIKSYIARLIVRL